MLKLKQLMSGSNSAVALVLVAATGAVLFTVMAGALIYGNTRSLIAAGDRVEHSQDVIAALDHESLLTERIRYRTRLYALTSNDEQLNRALASANQLDAATAHLKQLLTPEENNSNNLASLESCAAQLNRVVTGFTPKSVMPEALMQRCQQTIGLMVDSEQTLLQERTKGSQRSSFTSIGTEIAFVSLSLISLVVLFGFLFRDAILRRRVGEQMAHTNERLARSVSALEDRADESELLTSARDELQLCVSVEQVYRSAADSVARLLKGTSGSLCIMNNSRHLVEVVSNWNDGDLASAIEDFHTPDSCCGLRSGQFRWRLPGLSEIHCAHFALGAPERYLCMPIAAHGNTLGVLYVQCPTDETVRDVNQRIDGLRQLVQLTGMAVATLNLRTKLENQSIRDPLTGLFNRNFMQISLEREIARAGRRKQVLAVFMLDLDHFKRFNDTYGHAAGDTALKAVAEIFRASIRTEDIACRYGGEEFTIILPDVTAAVVRERAESIRRAVAKLRTPLAGEMYGEFAVSIGIALYPESGESVELLLNRADQALYRAKRLGRNQVVMAEESVSVAEIQASSVLHD